MGMTIDKTIEFFNGLECYTPQAKDARDVAIETMRKYQKIEEIVKEWREVGLEYDSCDAMMNIEKVVEDGEV
jgi:hypothetical protein